MRVISKSETKQYYLKVFKDLIDTSLPLSPPINRKIIYRRNLYPETTIFKK